MFPSIATLLPTTVLSCILLVAAVGTIHVDGSVIKIEGFLLDIYCINRGPIALDGANMITNPEDHSAHCAVLPICIPDGYTIMLPPTAGQTTYGQFYNLTTAGNAAAVEWLNTLAGSTKNLLVTMSGEIDNSGKFAIIGATTNTFGNMSASAATNTPATAATTAPAGAETITVTGILADIFCINRGPIALDGANMITHPEDHSVHCALLDVCIPDGYTIMTRPTAGQTTYGTMYNLTAEGNEAAFAYFKTLPDHEKNILVTMSGRIDSSGSGKFELVSDSSNTFQHDGKYSSTLPILLIVVVAVFALVVLGLMAAPAYQRKVMGCLITPATRVAGAPQTKSAKVSTGPISSAEQCD